MWSVTWYRTTTCSICLKLFERYMSGVRWKRGDPGLTCQELAKRAGQNGTVYMHTGLGRALSLRQRVHESSRTLAQVCSSPSRIESPPPGLGVADNTGLTSSTFRAQQFYQCHMKHANTVCSRADLGSKRLTCRDAYASLEDLQEPANKFQHLRRPRQVSGSTFETASFGSSFQSSTASATGLASAPTRDKMQHFATADAIVFVYLSTYQPRCKTNSGDFRSAARQLSRPCLTTSPPKALP